MNTKIIIYFFSILIVACTNKQNKNISKINIDIIETKPTSIAFNKLNLWTNINTIEKKWIKIEKDKEGYLIYDPCDGSTPTINFNNESNIIFNYQIEPPVNFNCNNWIEIEKNNVFSLDFFYKKNDEKNVLKMTIINTKKSIVLFEFDSEKWLMTPIENSNCFRKLKNNCDDFKRNDLQFEQYK